MTRMLQSTPYATSSYDAALSDFLDKNLGSVIYSMFPEIEWLQREGRIRKPTNIHGGNIIFPVELRSSSGFGPRGENDILPSADKVDMVQGSVPYRRGIKGRISLTAEALKYGRENTYNLADVMKQELRNALNTMKLHALPAIWGAGNGVLCSHAAVSSSTSVTINVTETSSACLPGTRWLHDGMSVISCNTPSNNYAADGSMTAAAEIAAVNSYTAITMASSISATDAYIFVEHQCSNTSTSAELARGSVTLGTANSYRGPKGFLAMCDAGTFDANYCGISSSTYPQWRAAVSSNGGTLRAISTSLIYSMFGKLSRRTSTLKPNLVIWCNWDVYQALAETLESFIEFRPRELKPGFEEYDIMVNGVSIPIKISHAVPGYMFFLNPEKIVFAEGQPLGVWKEGGGEGGWRDVADKTNVEMKLWWQFNIYTTNRAAHGIIMDISHTVVSF